MIRASEPTLDSIRAKVEAGERLSLDEGVFLYRPDVPLDEVGELANLVRERKNGNRALLQHQHAPEPDQRLRLSLRVLRVSLRLAQPQGLSDERRADPGPRPGSRRLRLHRNAHRRRPAPPDEIRLVLEPDPHPARRLSAAAPEGLDRRRDRLVRPHDRQADPRDPRRDDRGRPGQPARRRGRDLSSRGARQDLRAQGRRRPLDRHPPHGPRAGPAHQRHDALRPHRKRLPSRRPPGAAARAAGRNRRLPDLHPAGFSSRQHWPEPHQESRRASWTCGRWP